MILQELIGNKIAIWGLGKEAKSVVRYIHNQFPSQNLTVINDSRPNDDVLEEFSQSGPVTYRFDRDLNKPLSSVDVVIKSPGISSYRPEIEIAKSKGIIFTSATNIWFAEKAKNLTVVVTGSNGKSTTAALLACMLRNAGYSVGFGGNIGIPLLDLIGPEQPHFDIWIVELSSYQICDLNFSPDIGVLLNLYPEHIQWHGTIEQYYSDKLKLFRYPNCTPILNFRDRVTKKLCKELPTAKYFNSPDTFHFEEDRVLDQSDAIISLNEIKLKGTHNLLNVCAALTVLRHLSIDIQDCIAALSQFEGLPYRLQILGEKNTILFVNDSISTTPEAALAAVDAFPARPLTILLGGQDRQQNYKSLAKRVCQKPVVGIVTMYETGPRIAKQINRLKPRSKIFPVLKESRDIYDAMAIAKQLTPGNGLILLSPAAPSYDAFKNYQERGDIFSRLAGF